MKHFSSRLIYYIKVNLFAGLLAKCLCNVKRHFFFVDGRTHQGVQSLCCANGRSSWDEITIEGDAIYFKAFLTQTTQKLIHCHYLIIIYLIELIGQVMNLIDRTLKQTNQCFLKLKQ